MTSSIESSRSLTTQNPPRWRPDNALLQSLNRTSALVVLALRRLRHQFGLSLLALIGVILAVGLVTSAGFFSQAVDTVVMRQELAEYTRITGRPPFSARVFAIHSQTVPLSLVEAERLGERIATTLADAVGLPIKEVLMQVNSDLVRLRTEGGTQSTGRSPVSANVVHLGGVAPYMEIVEGLAPDAHGEPSDGVDVWLHLALAERMGVHAGSRIQLETAQGEIPAHIAGIWRPLDARDPFWLNNPDQDLADKLLMRRDDYLNAIEPFLPVAVRSATWRVVLDETRANPADGRQYVTGFERVGLLINRFLPEARVTTPALPLERFVGRQTTLTTLLLGFNVPGLGFLLYFLVLTSAVIAYWQRREIAILVSRGMGRLTVINFTLIESLILFLIGLPLGIGFGILLARIMGYASSFLSFQPRPPLPVSLDGVNWRLILLTLGIVLMARLWAAVIASGQSVATQSREHSRPQQGPFWYRYYLDFLLIIPAAYAYDRLLAQGSLGMLVQDSPEDLFKDPLLILVPALFIVSLSLLAMRPFPLIMRFLDWIAAHSPWLTLHLALRQLGRQSHTYINPLLLVIVSLALGVYTFSMAASLDRWLVDRIYYRSGADLAFEPFSEPVALSGARTGGDWIPPIEQYEATPGVESATRVGNYTTEIRLPNRRVRGRFMAVDRLDFPKVAWFRGDFSAESLGGLMNRLAGNPENVLVSQRFLNENALQIGDRIAMLVLTDIGISVDSLFTIAGTYTYFPTVYEEDLVVIGNLDYLFSFYGVSMPHHIWLRLDLAADSRSVLTAIPQQTRVDAIRVFNVAEQTLHEQAQMERVGVFGTLSISFLMSALMAALGLLTYSYASLHERLFQFSVLRAVGMPKVTLAGQVLLEYATLTAYGAIAGVLIGSLAAELFVPLFRVSGEAQMPLPPLLPVIAHNEIFPLVLGFATAMILLELVVLSSALYQRIFVALRMGDQG
ncbi:MAG: ABC transporter permease [Caldilineaceae bacterium]|nr:ABC transporter permease [Caldilineaceae bacterium]